MENYSSQENPEPGSSERRLTQAEIILKIALHVDGLRSAGAWKKHSNSKACAIASRLDGKMPCNYFHNNKFALVEKPKAFLLITIDSPV